MVLGLTITVGLRDMKLKDCKSNNFVLLTLKVKPTLMQGAYLFDKTSQQCRNLFEVFLILDTPHTNQNKGLKLH